MGCHWSASSTLPFHWLEEAYRERTLQLIYLKAGPKFDRLRRLNLAE